MSDLSSEESFKNIDRQLDELFEHYKRFNREIRSVRRQVKN